MAFGTTESGVGGGVGEFKGKEGGGKVTHATHTYTVTHRDTQHTQHATHVHGGGIHVETKKAL